MIFNKEGHHAEKKIKGPHSCGGKEEEGGEFTYLKGLSELCPTCDCFLQDLRAKVSLCPPNPGSEPGHGVHANSCKFALPWRSQERNSDTHVNF